MLHQVDLQASWPSTHVLGLDCSTQSMKAVIINSSLKVVAESSVNFDTDLPHYHTEGGVMRGGKSLHPFITGTDVANNEPASHLVVTAPSIMFAEALDLVFAKLSKKFDLSNVSAVSASGQQHGSVWWRHGARQILKTLSPSIPLSSQLQNAFAIPNGPIWMDSSTAAECKHLEQHVGGAQSLADICGARAYERFTGNQIAKVIAMSNSAASGGAYAKCERIALVSSMIVTLMLGNYAPIDISDGSGMNLLNLRTADWDEKLLRFTAGGCVAAAKELQEKLGKPAPAHTVIGSVCSYFQRKYGFSSKCKVVTASGDNPCSLAGLQLRESGDVAVSLGTSDTLFAVVPKSEARPSGSEGVVLLNPVDPQAAMLMLCFKNGSLTRERVRNVVLSKTAKPSWNAFNALINQTPPGNNGMSALFYLESEITPTVHVASPEQPLIARFNKSKQIKSFVSAAEEARALIEGQFVAYRHYAKMLGLHTPKRIIATGGGSQNATFLQILADVFKAPVYTMSVSGSAALGAAYRALHGYVNLKLLKLNKQCCQNHTSCDQAQPLVLSFAQMCAHASGGGDSGAALAASPRAEYSAAYEQAVARFPDIQKKALAKRALM